LPVISGRVVDRDVVTDHRPMLFDALRARMFSRLVPVFMAF